MTLEEITYRKAIFANNKAYIDSLNADPNNLAHFGINKFTDWAKEETNAMRGTIPQMSNSNSRAKIST